MLEKEFFNKLGYVKVSATRMKTMKSLEHEFKLPSEISKSTGLRDTQVSNAFSDLKKENLVVCVNEELKRGRIYMLTEDGKEIVQYL